MLQSEHVYTENLAKHLNKQKLWDTRSYLLNKMKLSSKFSQKKAEKIGRKRGLAGDLREIC